MSDATSEVHICAVCNSFGTKSCTKCLETGVKVTYCTRKRQREDWRSGHKTVCGQPLPTSKDESAFKVKKGNERRDAAPSPKSSHCTHFKEASPNEDCPPEVSDLMAEGIDILISRLPQNDDDAHGTVECLIPWQFKERILSAPGFPKALLEVPLHRIAMNEMGTGNEPNFEHGIHGMPQIGIFTQEDIEAGECIVDERSLVITSHMGETPRIPNLTRKELQKVAMDQMDESIETAWRRMHPVKQMSFYILKNAHTKVEDSDRPFLGRVRTNALDCGLDWGGTRYGGVCTILSRVNNSRSPNSAYTFDPVSLSFQLWAVRKIRAGEEVTIAYAGLTPGYAERREWLLRYGFECTCSACSEPKESDIRRRAVLNTKTRTLKDIKKWIKSKTASDDFLIAPAMTHLEMMEKEGLEALGGYCERLAEVFLCSVALGRKDESMKYRGLLMERQERIESTKGPLSYSVLEGTKDEPDVTRHPRWNARPAPQSP